MKKLFFIIILIFSFYSFLIAEEKIGYVNELKVNFRVKPNLKSKIIRQLNRPEKVEILDIVVTEDIKYRYWYKIRTAKNIVGYAYYLYIVTDKELIGENLMDSLSEVIFFEPTIGKIKFSNKLPMSVQLLSKIFPVYSVSSYMGPEEDGPEDFFPLFYCFTISDMGEVIMYIYSYIEYEDYVKKIIKSPHPNNINIDLIEIRSSKIKDIYGLKIGDTYQDIIKKRGNKLNIGNCNDGKYIGNDKLFYTIWGKYDDKFRQKYNFLSSDIPNEQIVKHNWKIILVTWPTSSW